MRAEDASNVPEGSRSSRDLAFLALLLLVGAGAVGSGVFQILVEGNTGPVAVFDAVLGVAVLLVTWIFLAPIAAPTWYGDPAPGSGRLIRPYLPAPYDDRPGHDGGSRSPGRSGRPAPSRSDRTGGRAPSADAQIPRWADPLVPRSPTPARTSGIAASAPTAEEPAAVIPISAPLDPEPSELPPPEPDPVEELPGEIPEGPPADPGDMVRELDLISAEIEHPPRRRGLVDHGDLPFGSPSPA